MLLPDADRAEIDPRKLYGYLLAPTHPVGRFKARSLPLSATPPRIGSSLNTDLRTHHLTQDATPGERLADGQLFTINAILKGPNGDSAMVRSVWFVPRAGGVPRFVTAYPGGAK